MNKLNVSLRIATGVAAAALLTQPLAGCSGASSSLPTPPASLSSAHLYVPAAVDAKGSAAQRVQPDASQMLFVSDNLNSKVYVFNAASKTTNPPIERTITDGIGAPNGIATDTAGNLWVANLAANTVTEYAKNSSSPRFTISNAMNGPYDVKVDGFGNVYVAMTGEYGGAATIVEYAAGTAEPINTWEVPQSNMQISGIALINPNQQGATSIYALEYQQNGSGGAKGGLLSCLNGEYVCTQLTNYLYGQTGGITLAKPPASQSLEFLAVDLYLPGVDVTIPNETPKQIITGGTPEFVTLNAKGTKLFVADRFYGRVEEYSFPKGKAGITFSVPGKTTLYGVATDPSGSYL